MLAPDGGGGRPKRLSRHHRRGRQRRRLLHPARHAALDAAVPLLQCQRPRKATAASEQTMYFQRHDLVSLKGMDVPGQADALGLGWVYMAPKDGLPGIIQKTGGGGGFITYMAMIPAKNVGVFVVVTRSELSKFTNMSDPVNRLVSDLAANKS